MVGIVFASDVATQVANAATTSDTAWYTAAGALVTALAAATASVYAAFKKEKRADDGTVAKELKGIITRLQNQLNKQQALVENYDGVLDQMRHDHSQCQVHLVELYGWCERANDWIIRQAAIARSHGDDPGELPTLPPHPMREAKAAGDRADFAAKTVSQDRELVREIDRRTDRPRGGGQGVVNENPDR